MHGGLCLVVWSWWSGFEPGLGHRARVSSWARKITLAVPLSTEMYLNWIPGIVMLEGSPVVDLHLI